MLTVAKVLIVCAVVSTVALGVESGPRLIRVDVDGHRPIDHRIDVSEIERARFGGVVKPKRERFVEAMAGETPSRIGHLEEEGAETHVTAASCVRAGRWHDLAHEQVGGASVGCEVSA